MPNTFYPAPAPRKKAEAYDHIQSAPSSIWTIPHPLKCRPSVTTVTSAGVQVFGDVTCPDINNVLITFADPTSGFAHLV